MLSLPVFILLMVLSAGGLLLGAFYYLRPEKIVYRRIKEQHWETARQDDEFRRWLELEIASQINRARRIGMMLIVLEAIWMVLIFFAWQRGLGT